MSKGKTLEMYDPPTIIMPCFSDCLGAVPVSSLQRWTSLPSG